MCLHYKYFGSISKSIWKNFRFSSFIELSLGLSWLSDWFGVFIKLICKPCHTPYPGLILQDTSENQSKLNIKKLWFKKKMNLPSTNYFFYLKCLIQVVEVGNNSGILSSILCGSKECVGIEVGPIPYVFERRVPYFSAAPF